MKVRFSEFEVDDRATLEFELLGASENGERAFAG